MSQIRYFSMPIDLLRGVISGDVLISRNLHLAIDYSIYRHAVNLPYSGNNEDDIENDEVTQLRAAAKYLYVKIGSEKQILQSGKKLHDEYHDKDTVFCSVNTEKAWEYINNAKSEDQIAQFCAFCATKSIIGKATHRKTNKPMIVARMLGFKTYDNLLAGANEKELALAKKYMLRYHFDKMINALELYWHLKQYSDHIRGMFISYSLNHNQLALINEESKLKVKKQKLKEIKAKARAFAQAKPQANA